MICSAVSLVHDVIVVCGRACDAVNSDTDAEVSHVLRRCGTASLFNQTEDLTSIIEQLGGRTGLSDDDDGERQSREVPNDQD
jgi:hypothetical protein